MFKYIVVGTGRCGSVYLAKLLTEVGIPCSHERIFNANGISPLYSPNSGVAKICNLKVKSEIAESSYMAVPYLNHPYLKSATIIHLVRNPLKVILSYNNYLQFWHHLPRNKWERFMILNGNIPNNLSPLEKNSSFVYNWNKLIEEKSKDRKYIRIRLEHDIDKLLDYLNIDLDKRDKPEISNNHEAWAAKAHISGRSIWQESGKWIPLEKPATEEDIMNGIFKEKLSSLIENYNY